MTSSIITLARLAPNTFQALAAAGRVSDQDVAIESEEIIANVPSISCGCADDPRVDFQPFGPYFAERLKLTVIADAHCPACARRWHLVLGHGEPIIEAEATWVFAQVLP